MFYVIFDGKKEAKIIIESLRYEVDGITSRLGRKPKLVVIRTSKDPASNLFVTQKKKVGEKIGIDVAEVWTTSNSESVRKLVNELNSDTCVDGYFFQFPIKGMGARLWEYIDIFKDVEGLGALNLGRLIEGRQIVVPPTALAGLHAIACALGQHLDRLDLDGKNVCIISRSRLIGIPLFHLLVRKGATVAMCHSRTRDLGFYTINADIVVSGVGAPGLITADMVVPKSIVIDFGTTISIDKKGNCIIKGDVDFEKVSRKVTFITPPKGGLGPLVVAYLFKNLVTLVKLRFHLKKDT